jgi:uncharacterized membrane protein HdeD (DUF308 family)
MRYVKQFGTFWYDFVVGEDWRIAVGVVGVLAGGALLVAADALSETLLAVFIAAAIMSVVVASVLLSSLADRRSSSPE